MDEIWRSIQRAITSVSRQCGDDAAQEEERVDSEFRNLCSILETHNKVVVNMQGLNKASAMGYLNEIRTHNAFGVDLRSKNHIFLSAVADSPGLEHLDVHQRHVGCGKDKLPLLEAAGRNQNLKDLSITHPELFSSPLAQFLREKRSTLTKLTLRFFSGNFDHWAIEQFIAEPIFPLFRPMVRAVYSTRLGMEGAEIIKDAETRCRNLAEGILAAEELNHIELGRTVDISDVYLCSVLELVGGLPSLCSLTLHCRKERHIELLTAAMQSSKTLARIVLTGEVCEVLERCDTGTVDSFFYSAMSCRSLRELRFPHGLPWRDVDADSFVFHLIRLVNQHPNLVALACRFTTIDATRQFCSSVKSSVVEELDIHLGFEIDYHYPEYCRMLAKLLSQLPKLKSLSFRYGHEYGLTLNKSEEECVFRAVRAHQTLTFLRFEDKVASYALHDFGQHCNLRRKMAGMIACPLNELVSRLDALSLKPRYMSAHWRYDLGISIIYGVLRQRDDWFGVEHFNGNDIPLQERSESEEQA